MRGGESWRKKGKMKRIWSVRGGKEGVGGRMSKDKESEGKAGEELGG